MVLVFRLALLSLLFAFTEAGARAEPCRNEGYKGNQYIVCEFDPSTTDLRLFWRNSEGVPFRTFATLDSYLAERGETLQFAMNAGMYDEEFRPIGLYVEAGDELVRLNTARPGTRPLPNFYRKPNGVFYIGATGAGVLTTEAFQARHPRVDFASQSGPMLVIDGAIHPDLIPGSTDRKLRDGVGVTSSSMIYFAISLGSVNFYDFALFFRDHLGCRSALFLDGGSAPGLYAPELGRNDSPGHGGYGPIIGVVRKLPSAKTGAPAPHDR